MKLRYILMLLFIGMIAACKKDNGTTPNNNNNGNNNGSNNESERKFDVNTGFTFECKLMDNAWKAKRVKVEVKDNEELTMTGIVNIDNDYIEIGIGEYEGKPDSFELWGAQPYEVKLRYCKEINGTIWDVPIGNGTITLTEVTADRVKGTFTCKGSNMDIQEGVFDVPIRQ